MLQAAIVKNEIKDRPILSFELLASGRWTVIEFEVWVLSLVCHKEIAARSTVQRKD
jgi:hypothetical protein